MKNLTLAICLLISTFAFSQQKDREWGNVKGTTFTFKEVAPIWPGCESKTGPAIDVCFKQKLSRHVAKNFKYPAAEYKNNVQGKVTVEFEINEKGIVVINKVSGASPGLQKEAKRNIMTIPKMKRPGLLAGKPRSISYTVPFNFKTGK